MSRETWKSFWMKAAVFLLGMLLLPAAVWYGTMTAIAYVDGWYGQTGHGPNVGIGFECPGRRSGGLGF